jgi:4-alpha-glucanotransferase
MLHVAEFVFVTAAISNVSRFAYFMLCLQGMTISHETAGSDDNDLIAAGLRALGVENFVLVIHDQSFPSDPDEDTGRGSPYSNGAHRFLAFARRLGFNGIQFGPQGQTSRVNPSPYDGTLFSRNALSIALAPLTESGGNLFRTLLSRSSLERIVSARDVGVDDRSAYARAFDAMHGALDDVYTTFRTRLEDPQHAHHASAVALAARLAAFTRANAGWLDNDARFEALAEAYGTDDVRMWPSDESDKRGERGDALTRDRYALTQFIAHEQHDELRRVARRLGLKLFGDLQVGISTRDFWSRRALFLPGYLMGAPPSRTNPDGQPWNYPVFDPAQVLKILGATRESGVLRFMRARLGKLFAEFDGIRLDHPHGLVCPWVYRSDDPDALHAVQTGARIFDSPNVPGHEALASFAIPRPDQLAANGVTPRYADDWVAFLSDAQVESYSALFDVIVEQARENGRPLSDVVCEVLSTQPYPLARVMARFGLGRFRVTQKANLSVPSDVYRTENAAPHDWIMVGNHDTLPIWRLVNARERAGSLAAQARYLASRLVSVDDACAEPTKTREAFAAHLLQDPNRIAEAKLADLFTAGVRNVMVFFPDLFGMTDIYNRPGVVSEDNWTLRVHPTYARDYAERLAQGKAFNIPHALAMALRAKSTGEIVAKRDLIEALDTRSRSARERR